MPWIGDEEDDLAFEEDFPFEDEDNEMVDESPRRGKRGKKGGKEFDDE